MLNEQRWPEYDESKCVENTVEIAVQVNGKLKPVMTVSVDASKEDAIAQAKAQDNVKASMEGKNLVKEIYVPGKIVNIVVK